VFGERPRFPKIDARLLPVLGSPAVGHVAARPRLSSLKHRKRGDGSFEDVSAGSGVEASTAGGKGLGVVASDYDDDGDTDLYVANDTTRNFLFRNDGGGRMKEVGLESGVAYNADGLPEAGMGTDWGDVDRDGRFDLVMAGEEVLGGRRVTRRIRRRGVEPTGARYDARTTREGFALDSQSSYEALEAPGAGGRRNIPFPQ